MNTSLIDLLSISPRAAGAVSAAALIFLAVLDVYGSVDDQPGNTPRQILARWAGWARRVLGVRVTGAPIPFALGVLLGHWFHPGNLPNLAGQFLGLGLLLGIAVLLSVLSGFFAAPTAMSGPLKWPVARWSGPLSVLGIVLGALLWPVGG